jgi:Ribbon-helix-helix protein, copG family
MQRTTVYFSPRLYRALQEKAATTGRGFSELVNEAVRLTLREDAID